jgi:CNT family concentrative nucleoside transporter
LERFTGLIGVALILGIAFLMSKGRKNINYRVILSGLALQLALAFFILKTDLGQEMFATLGGWIRKLLELSDKAGNFVFGVLVDGKSMAEVFGPAKSFIFIFKVMPTIIFVSVLVSMAYHVGLMQRIVSVIARGVYYLMGVSGSEALSNVASAFVGQVEAQILIKPYVPTMTRSALLASMSGSMACIAGGVMAVYIGMGVPAEYLLAASIMAAPASLVISKIAYPETEESETKGKVTLEVKKTHANLLDAISHGASDGMKISINVAAMLLGFLALIYLTDVIFHQLGHGLVWCGLTVERVGYDLNTLDLKTILGTLFAGFAWCMGVPAHDVYNVGTLMGEKLVVNEFVAYGDMTGMMARGELSTKAITIASFALCGFANFSSIAIQIGGIGELAPSRRTDLSQLGFRALVCGTLASYLSATIAGMLIDVDFFIHFGFVTRYWAQIAFGVIGAAILYSYVKKRMAKKVE